MDLELLVRLMQMQMVSSTYTGRAGAGSIKGSDFALVLAALMDSPRGGGMSVSRPQGVPPARALKNTNLLREINPGTGVNKRNAGTKAQAPGTGLEALVDRVAAKYGLDSGLLRAVVRVESDYNPLTVSSAGAMGLMQLMPETAKSLGVKNPFDPLDNLDGGARYLKSMIERYGGNIKLALAAYNAGPGAVDRHGGVPPYEETTSYLKKINRLLGGLMG
ncbi:MAG: lytic transglycosylase domain-containing protein [Desulfocucumaceae bacterium]